MRRGREDKWAKASRAWQIHFVRLGTDLPSEYPSQFIGNSVDDRWAKLVNGTVVCSSRAKRGIEPAEGIAMSVVRLESYDNEVEELPDVCMKCGAPSAVLKRKQFAWYPPWVGVLLLAGLIPFAIVAMILTKRCRVEVPLCDRHKNHWLMRQVLVICTLFALLAIVFGTFIATVDNKGNDSLLGYVCGGWVILMIGWIALACVVHYTSIRPKEITDISITLASVSEQFAEAYEAEEARRPSTDRLDELARDRWEEGRRRASANRRRTSDPDRVRRPDEDEGRRSPPDAYRE
jgi:hypothetical protein